MKNKTLREEFIKRYCYHDGITYRVHDQVAVWSKESIFNWFESKLTQREAEVRGGILEEVRSFLKDSNVFGQEYIYTRKVRLLEKFDEKFTFPKPKH